MQQAATANLLEFAAAKVCCGIIYELIEELALEERTVVIGNELHVHHTLLEDYLFNPKAQAFPVSFSLSLLFSLSFFYVANIDIILYNSKPKG